MKQVFISNSDHISVGPNIEVELDLTASVTSKDLKQVTGFSTSELAKGVSLASINLMS